MEGNSSNETGALVLLASVITLAMVIGTLPQYALAVLAPFAIEAGALTRTQIGILGTCFMLAAALMAPSVGAIVDRIGSRRALQMLVAAFA